jgi:imidazolonepropionase-like amidohydrolase
VVDKKEKISAALDTLQMEGSDFVKVYNKIPKEVYFDLVKEATRRGMRVEGHLPMSVSAIDASNAGQRSFEHLLGIPDLCTKEKLFANNNKFNWFASAMSEKDYGLMQFDEATAAKNFQILKRNNTYICPTLVVWNSYFHPDNLFENDPHISKFPVEMQRFWAGEIGKYQKKDTAYKEISSKKYENFKNTTFLLYKYGVPLIAGTDAINPYCYPGYSLHKELSLLKECGIPDKEVLKMATINAAQFLKLEKRFGEVKVGLEASLVLLNDNPLEDINNTTKIEKVILRGKIINRTEINAMLNE